MKYGGGMPSGHGNNNGGQGATQTKGGDLAKAISRPAGYKATCSAMESKTRSQATGVSKHNQWESAGCGWGEGERVLGY